jgi:hypothetical protein
MQVISRIAGIIDINAQINRINTNILLAKVP